MSPSAEQPVSVPDVSGSALGCWSCQVVSRLDRGDPHFQLRMLAFLAEHDSEAGHRPWIDLTGRIPEQAEARD